MSLANITERKKQKEREFSLEKIATAIHCGNMISSIRNKYIDPLIIRHRNLLPPKIKKRKLKINKENDPFSLNKILYHDFIKQKERQEANNSHNKENKKEIENEKEKETEKGIQTKNNTSNKLLPIIPDKNLNNRNLKFSDSLLITSGMFKQKEYCKDPGQKVKLGVMLNLKNRDNYGMYNLYPRIENINKINDRYKLQLDLKHLNFNSLTVKKQKKYTKRGYMNLLFNKYASLSTAGVNYDSLSNTNSTVKSKKRHKTHKKSTKSIKSEKSQNSIELVRSNSLNNNIFENNTIDILKKEYFNDDTNTFITKLSVEKKPKKDVWNINDIKRNKKRLKLKQLKIYENNKNIINMDQKVYIDCLYSKVKEKIEPDKLIYEHIDKTTFELQRESSYKKVKKFESLIDRIVKTQV